MDEEVNFASSVRPRGGGGPRSGPSPRWRLCWAQFPEAQEGEAEVSNPLTSSVSGSSTIFIERMVILQDAAESLLCKLYELYTMQDFLAVDFPKLSEILIKKFPEHPKEINLSKVEKGNLERLLGNAEGMLENLQPWYYCLVDVMEYYGGVLSVLGEANALLGSADPPYCESLVKSFAQTASDAMRVQILPGLHYKGVLIVQLYALAYYLDYRSKPISGFDSHEKPVEHDSLLVFLMRFDSVIPCLQQDFADFQLVISPSRPSSGLTVPWRPARTSWRRRRFSRRTRGTGTPSDLSRTFRTSRSARTR